MLVYYSKLFYNHKNQFCNIIYVEIKKKNCIIKPNLVSAGKAEVRLSICQKFTSVLTSLILIHLFTKV